MRDEVATALISMGVAPVGNRKLVEMIDQNVKELCSKDNIIARVVYGLKDGRDMEDGGKTDSDDENNDSGSDDVDGSDVGTEVNEDGGDRDGGDSGDDGE